MCTTREQGPDGFQLPPHAQSKRAEKCSQRATCISMQLAGTKTGTARDQRNLRSGVPQLPTNNTGVPQRVVPGPPRRVHCHAKSVVNRQQPRHALRQRPLLPVEPLQLRLQRRDFLCVCVCVCMYVCVCVCVCAVTRLACTRPSCAVLLG
jgi:hypothetical protein